MEFRCVKDCSQCCIEREYYPSKEFGKIGVLILPAEKEEIERLASSNGIEVTIIPRIGVSSEGADGPTEIIAYQMMGADENGNTCPFLDTKSEKRSPHGGLACRIYEQRPLACKAYPVIETSPITLDQKCKFCQEHGAADGNLAAEIDALERIKSEMPREPVAVWRYATGVGDPQDRDTIKRGWIRQIEQ